MCGGPSFKSPRARKNFAKYVLFFSYYTQNKKRTICSSVSQRVSTRDSPDLSFSKIHHHKHARDRQTDMDRHRRTQRQTDRGKTNTRQHRQRTEATQKQDKTHKIHDIHDGQEIRDTTDRKRETRKCSHDDTDRECRDACLCVGLS